MSIEQVTVQTKVTNRRVVRFLIALVAILMVVGNANTAKADLNLNLAYVSATYNLGYGAEGATWDGTHLWICDSPASATTLIRKYDTSGGGFSLVTSIPMPTTALRGLAYDGNYLWSSKGDTYYKIDPSNGNLQYTIMSMGTGGFGGMTYDGQYLWKSSRPEFNQIDPGSGNIVDTIFGIDLPGLEEGMTYEGGDLFAISYTTASDSTIWHIDPGTETLKSDSFALPSGLYNGLAYDGDNLWAADWSGARVVKISFAVPEPSPLVVLVLVIAGLVTRRRHRIRVA